MSRYERLTVGGQRVDIDVDGRVGVIAPANGRDEWVLTLGTVRRDAARPSRWIACAELEQYPWGETPPEMPRTSTRREGILNLLELTAWAPSRRAQRTPLPKERP
jgi:hypothetical protein